MSLSLNKVCLIGNVGKEPQIKTFDNGNKMALFSLATNESYKDHSSGEKKNITDWHNVVIKSPFLVDLVRSHVQTGTYLYIEGQLRNRKWTDNTGVVKFSNEVVLSGYEGKLIILQNNGEESNDSLIDDEMPF